MSTCTFEKLDDQSSINVNYLRGTLVEWKLRVLVYGLNPVQSSDWKMFSIHPAASVWI